MSNDDTPVWVIAVTVVLWAFSLPTFLRIFWKLLNWASEDNEMAKKNKATSTLPHQHELAVTHREFAHILFALRSVQANLDDESFADLLKDSEHLAGGIKPMSASEIDALCERLNTNR